MPVKERKFYKGISGYNADNKKEGSGGSNFFSDVSDDSLRQNGFYYNRKFPAKARVYEINTEVKKTIDSDGAFKRMHFPCFDSAGTILFPLEDVELKVSSDGNIFAWHAEDGGKKGKYVRILSKTHDKAACTCLTTIWGCFVHPTKGPKSFWFC